MKDIDKWKVPLQGLAGNLPLEDCESSLLMKCPTSQGKLSTTRGLLGDTVPRNHEKNMYVYGKLEHN